MKKPDDVTEALNRILSKIDTRNRVLFYSVIVLMVLGMMTVLAIASGHAVKEDKDTYIKVIQACGMFVGFLFIMIRQDRNTAYEHQQHHRRASEAQAVISGNDLVIKQLDQAKDQLEKTKEIAEKKSEQVISEIKQTKELAASVDKKLNGGLHDTIREELNKSPFPTTRQELVDFIRLVSDCTDNSKSAVKQAFDELKAEGKLK